MGGSRAGEGTRARTPPRAFSSTGPGACRRPAIGSDVGASAPSRSTPNQGRRLEAMEIRSLGQEGQEPTTRCAPGPDATDGGWREHMSAPAPLSADTQHLCARLSFWSPSGYFLPSRGSLNRACNTSGLPNCSCFSFNSFSVSLLVTTSERADGASGGRETGLHARRTAPADTSTRTQARTARAFTPHAALHCM